MAGAAGPHAPGPVSHAPGHSSCPPLPGKEKEPGQSPPGLGGKKKCPSISSKSGSAPACSLHRVKRPVTSLSEASSHVQTYSSYLYTAFVICLQSEALPFSAAALFASVFMPEYRLSALCSSAYCDYISSPEAAFGLSWRWGRRWLIISWYLLPE